MNFFQAQDRARRNSILLFFLFAAAVASLVILVYLGIALALGAGGINESGAPEFNPDLFAKTTAAVLAVVIFGSLTKTLALAAGGGEAVAKAMGGRLVPPATRDPDEKRLINIVEEMSIASGVPAPRVYVIPDPALNAFAAGTRPDNAVVGVTRGAMLALSRDEMQGVVAHEFSHILNGDMRLNLRLIGILHGILIIGYIGYFLLRSAFYGSVARRDNRGAAPLMMIGAALAIAGFAGSFFGNWIRAAVSRQREFLADASAVQFTRNPNGIGGALEKIGKLSGVLKNPRASECRHMCLADSVASGFANPFATHPPLEERIRRVLPNWKPGQNIGNYDGETKTRIAQLSQASETDGAVGIGGTSGMGEVGMGGMGFSASDSGAESKFESAPASESKTESASSSSLEGDGTPPDLFGMLFGAGASDAGESAAEMASHIGELRPDSREFAARLHRAIPDALLESARDPHSARALLYAMLLDPRDEDCRAAQLEILRTRGDAGVYDETLRLAKPAAALPLGARLPLADLAAPALRGLSPRQHRLFAENMDALVAADSAIDLFEWCLQAVVLRHLAEAFGTKRARPATLRKSRAACAYALSILSRAGHPEGDEGEGGEEKDGEARTAFAEAAGVLEGVEGVEGVGGAEGVGGVGGRGGVEFDITPFHPNKLLDATHTLAGLPPLEKEKFIRACAFCASRDGVISPSERNLLTVFASLLDCPIPPAARL